MSKTVEQRLREHPNDYGAHERHYRSVTGGELVRDPLSSPRHGPEALGLSASVVIPAWNARRTIESCLTSIELSSFNRRHPELLEVVVVDDGSTDGTWELLARLRPALNLKLLRQANRGRAHARNAGFSAAEGDIVICCDADQVLTPFSIEELVKRHQVLEGVMLVGFRADVEARDPRFRPERLPECFHLFAAEFPGDYRLKFGAGGWPRNFCAESDHLKLLDGGRQLWIKDKVEPDADIWDITRLCCSCLFSLRRRDCLRIDGFDERFTGWGCEDMAFAALALALGNVAIPVYSAFALHFAHPERNAAREREAAANYRVFRDIMESPHALEGGGVIARAGGRVEGRVERRGAAAARRDLPPVWFDALDAAAADHRRRGHYLHHLGRYEEAAEAYASAVAGGRAAADALAEFGGSLYACGRHAEAAEVFAEASRRRPADASPRVGLARAQAAAGDFRSARDSLARAARREPENGELLYILDCPADVFLGRGRMHAAQGYRSLARRDFEAVLMREPGHPAARREWEKCLDAPRAPTA